MRVPVPVPVSLCECVCVCVRVCSGQNLGMLIVENSLMVTAFHNSNEGNFESEIQCK